MLTQTTRRHLQEISEYEGSANRDCARGEFILVPVPFPIPAITAIAFRVVADMILGWMCMPTSYSDRPVFYTLIGVY